MKIFSILELMLTLAYQTHQKLIVFQIIYFEIFSILQILSSDLAQLSSKVNGRMEYRWSFT